MFIFMIIMIITINNNNNHNDNNNNSNNNKYIIIIIHNDNNNNDNHNSSNNNKQLIIMITEIIILMTYIYIYIYHIWQLCSPVLMGCAHWSSGLEGTWRVPYFASDQFHQFSHGMGYPFCTLSSDGTGTRGKTPNLWHSLRSHFIDVMKTWTCIETAGMANKGFLALGTGYGKQFFFFRYEHRQVDPHQPATALPTGSHWNWPGAGGPCNWPIYTSWPLGWDTATYITSLRHSRVKKPHCLNPFVCHCFWARAGAPLDFEPVALRTHWTETVRPISGLGKRRTSALGGGQPLAGWAGWDDPGTRFSQQWQ